MLNLVLNREVKTETYLCGSVSVEKSLPESERTMKLALAARRAITPRRKDEGAKQRYFRGCHMGLYGARAAGVKRSAEGVKTLIIQERQLLGNTIWVLPDIT
jgi:hypothetical protein